MECQLCFYLFVDISAVSMPFQLPQIDSPVFWHPVRCKLRLHLARLSAVRVVDIVALCSPIFSVKVAVAYGFGNVL